MNKINSYKIHLPSLIPFGFILSDNRYTYREVFMEGQFEAVVEVDEAGQLSSYVWDCEMEEVYTAHLVTAPAGAFVGQLREAYQSILARVEEACCIALPFSKDQSNRLAQLIKEQWGDLPDYPFAKLPTYGAFATPTIISGMPWSVRFRGTSWMGAVLKKRWKLSISRLTVGK